LDNIESIQDELYEKEEIEWLLSEEAKKYKMIVDWFED